MVPIVKEVLVPDKRAKECGCYLSILDLLEQWKRMHLMDNATHYKLFRPLNREFAFDVDVSAITWQVSSVTL